jgi:hypothetical protein
VWFEIYGLSVIIHQYRAESFSVAKGNILSGEVVAGHRRHSSYYYSLLRYSYQVNGKNYIGRRYRYDGKQSFSESASAERMVREHPVGSEIQVYYNPADPSDSVLSQRLEGGDIGIFLIILPFCLFVLYWTVEFARQIVPSKPITGKVKSISDRKKKRVRHSQYMPWPMSLLAVGLLSGIAGMLMIITPYVSLGAGAIVVLLISLAGAIVYFWRRKRISVGYDEVRRRKRAARTE